MVAETCIFTQIEDTEVIMRNEDFVPNLKDTLQNLCRRYLLERFEKPYVTINMKIRFPNENHVDSIIFDTAQFYQCPYSVFYFIRMVDKWEGGCFHRNANHVQQAKPNHNLPPLAFQEYNPEFPHRKNTLGFAGRPGGPQFYISTRDNTRNHGPGSQKSTTNEADSCFGIINDSLSIDVVDKLRNSPIKGFIADKTKCVIIEAFEFH